MNSRTKNYNQIGRVSDEKTKVTAYILHLSGLTSLPI